MNTEQMLKNLTETVGNPEEVANIHRIISEHKWQFAKTMPYVPHEYSVRKFWANKEDYDVLLNFVWDNGMEAFFGQKAQLKRYWFDHENGYYYFVCPEDFTEDRKAAPICVLINRGRIDQYKFWIDDSAPEPIIRCRVKHPGE